MSEAIAAIIGALVGSITALITSRFELRQKDDELFLKAMEFLGGGSQARNLGLAAIELYWAKYSKHRALCIALLIGSAIYLLLQSKQDDAQHEIYNLTRIMDLLLEKIPHDNSQQDRYKSLEGALVRKIGGAPGGLKLDSVVVEEWRKRLSANWSAHGRALPAG